MVWEVASSVPTFLYQTLDKSIVRCRFLAQLLTTYFAVNPALASNSYLVWTFRFSLGTTHPCWMCQGLHVDLEIRCPSHLQKALCEV